MGLELCVEEASELLASVPTQRCSRRCRACCHGVWVKRCQQHTGQLETGSRADPRPVAVSPLLCQLGAAHGMTEALQRFGIQGKRGEKGDG